MCEAKRARYSGCWGEACAYAGHLIRRDRKLGDELIGDFVVRGPSLLLDFLADFH